MSAIGGIYRINGPVLAGELARMDETVDFRGPDGKGAVSFENAGLMHRWLRNREETRHEAQPLALDDVCITADCRLDNRGELEAELKKISGPFGPLSTVSDAAFLLLAYRHWGEDCLSRIVGDFSFAVWDGKARTLFCARDPLGLKPFVYAWDGRQFIFGSEIKQIFSVPGVRRDLNELYLADHLLMNFIGREDTPYTALKRLPPGHFIRLHEASFFQAAYSALEPLSVPLSTASLEENAEKFRALFDAAVRARACAPSGLRLGALLSGGLDSSSIVATAAAFSPPGFPVFSHAFSEKDDAYRPDNTDSVEEASYRSALITRCGLEAHSLDMKGTDPFEGAVESHRQQEVPLLFPNLAAMRRLFSLMKKESIRAFYHGEGGDELFLVGPQAASEALRRGRLSEFVEVFSMMRAKKGTFHAGYSVLSGLLPAELKAPLFYYRASRPPEWLDPVFFRCAGLSGRRTRSLLRLSRESGRGAYNYGILEWLESGHIPIYLEAIERAAAGQGMEIRLPFLDVRLLRFMCSVPMEQKSGKGLSKPLLRRAMAGRLPGEILERPGKSEFTPVIANALAASPAAKDAFFNPHPALRAMIAPEKARRLYEDCLIAKARRSPVAVWDIWRIASLDAWLKHKSY